MKKLLKVTKALFLLFSIAACQKNGNNPPVNPTGGGSASLELTINGQVESFNMYDPDIAAKIDKSAPVMGTWAMVNHPDFIDYLTIGGTGNGSFTLWAGSSTLTNSTYDCFETPYCDFARVEVSVLGSLNNRLETLYNSSIFRLELSGQSAVTISDLGGGKVSVSWAGLLNVKDFNGNVLGTLPASFTADQVDVDDFR